MSSDLTRNPDRLAMAKLRLMAEHEKCGTVKLLYLDGDGLWECIVVVGQQQIGAIEERAWQAVAKCHLRFLELVAGGDSDNS